MEMLCLARSSGVSRIAGEDQCPHFTFYGAKRSFGRGNRHSAGSCKLSYGIRGCSTRKSQTSLPVSGSEDCLYLNICQPASAKRVQLPPVLFFIHGDSNQKGMGSDYDPSEMVSKTRIIVVKAGMRWVRENILAFGSDPLDVTIASESAGAIDKCASPVSPRAPRPFNKAILESMYCPAATHDRAWNAGNSVATARGCTDAQTAASCMRETTADVLNAAGN
jgi:para-nitrobenzyl esterase